MITIQQIKMARTGLRLSQGELAKRVGLSLTGYQAIEAGKYPIIEASRPRWKMRARALTRGAACASCQKAIRSLSSPANIPMRRHCAERLRFSRPAGKPVSRVEGLVNMTSELDEVEEPAETVSDTQIAVAAVVDLREEFRALGCHVAVDWSDALTAAKRLETAYLSIYESILEQARSLVQ
jgi:DNA-binding XRE family transcriptional regulator